MNSPERVPVPPEHETPTSPDKDTVFYMAMPQPEYEDLEEED